jgi:hypothetical protein
MAILGARQKQKRAVAVRVLCNNYKHEQLDTEETQTRKNTWHGQKKNRYNKTLVKTYSSPPQTKQPWLAKRMITHNHNPYTQTTQQNNYNASTPNQF